MNSILGMSNVSNNFVKVSFVMNPSLYIYTPNKVKEALFWVENSRSSLSLSLSSQISNTKIIIAKSEPALTTSAPSTGWMPIMTQFWMNLN
jgi:hypothetical protein